MAKNLYNPLTLFICKSHMQLMYACTLVVEVETVGAQLSGTN